MSQPSLQDTTDPEKGGAKRRPNAHPEAAQKQKQESGSGGTGGGGGPDKPLSRQMSRQMSRRLSRDQGDEYSNLVKYISTYRDKSGAQEEGDGEEKEKRLWYAPWKRVVVTKTGETKKKGKTEFKVPETWLETDPDEGLTDADVEERTRLAGYNELTSEKENQFLKFLSYFQGPILYGKWLKAFS